MILQAIVSITLLAASGSDGVSRDEVSEAECAAHYLHVSAVMEMSSASKNRNRDAAYLAKTAQSIALYRERARDLMVRAGRIAPADESLPQDVLDREETLFSDLMNGRSDMNAVARMIARCDAAHDFPSLA